MGTHLCLGIGFDAEECPQLGRGTCTHVAVLACVAPTEFKFKSR